MPLAQSVRERFKRQRLCTEAAWVSGGTLHLVVARSIPARPTTNQTAQPPIALKTL